MVHDWEDLERLSPIERIEAMAVEAARPVPMWAGKFIAQGYAEGYVAGYAQSYGDGYAEGCAEVRGKGYAEVRAGIRAEGRAEGREESLDTARKKILLDVCSRFDPETAGNLAERLESITDLDLLLEICAQIWEGKTGSELLASVEVRKQEIMDGRA